MKIQLLIAVGESDYAEHLSSVMAESYEDVFEVNICSDTERMERMLAAHQFDVALFDAQMVEAGSFGSIRLPVVLCDELSQIGPRGEGLKKIRKHQRISGIISEILSGYAEASNNRNMFNDAPAHITVVWSPAGGSGKTTAALAYGAQKVAQGQKTLYLNLEPFSSGEVYFEEKGRSISTVLDKLENNAELLLRSVRMEDNGSGIYYLGKPENYDDVNILTADDVATLITDCAHGMDELVVDMGNTYDMKVRRALEMADKVLLVIDASPASRMKWEQFKTQHDLYGCISSKLTLVANRGVKVGSAEAVRVVSLPLVQSNDPVVVYKTLSVGYFSE